MVRGKYLLFQYMDPYDNLDCSSYIPFPRPPAPVQPGQKLNRPGVESRTSLRRSHSRKEPFPRGSEIPIFEVPCCKKHTLNGFWDPSSEILGTWTLWEKEPRLRVAGPKGPAYIGLCWGPTPPQPGFLGGVGLTALATPLWRDNVGA